MRTENQTPEKKMVRNWQDSIMPCYSWLLHGPFIFLPSNIKAIELRGHGHPVQEIDGVWRGGRAPSSHSVSESFSWFHLNTLEKAIKSLETELCLDSFQLLHRDQEKLSSSTCILCFPRKELSWWAQG